MATAADVVAAAAVEVATVAAALQQLLLWAAAAAVCAVQLTTALAVPAWQLVQLSAKWHHQSSMERRLCCL